MRNPASGHVVPVVATLIGLLLPLLVQSPYWRHLLVLTLIFGILAISLDIIVGTMGQFSFGHQTFFGLAAYTTAILTTRLQWPVWCGSIAGIAVAASAGFIVGWVALRRARGLYLAIITLGVAQMVWLVARNWFDLTGGQSGIAMVPPLSIYVPGRGILPIYDEAANYYVVLAVLLVVVYVVTAWRRSRSGQAVAAIRENERLAESIGIQPRRYFLHAFVLAATLAGVSGVLYGHFNGQVAPLSLSVYYMFWLLVMVIVGGASTILGPIVGAGIFVFVPEWLQWADEYRIVIFGILLFGSVLGMPRGIVPTAATLILRLFAHAKAVASIAGARP